MGTFILFSDARIMERVHTRAMNVTIALKGGIRENGLWSWIIGMRPSSCVTYEQCDED